MRNEKNEYSFLGEKMWSGWFREAQQSSLVKRWSTILQGERGVGIGRPEFSR
jgi:hypothetical protein